DERRCGCCTEGRDSLPPKQRSCSVSFSPARRFRISTRFVKKTFRVRRTADLEATRTKRKGNEQAHWLGRTKLLQRQFHGLSQASPPSHCFGELHVRHPRGEICEPNRRSRSDGINKIPFHAPRPRLLWGKWYFR